MDRSYCGAKPETVRKFPSLINYIREKNSDLYDFLIETATLSYLEREGGKLGLTFLMPSKEYLVRAKKAFADWDYELSLGMIKALIVRGYLPDGAAWEERKADIPNALGRRVPVEDAKGSKVKLVGGAILTLNKEYVPIRSHTAIWDMAGEYDFESAPESEAIRYRPNKGEKRGAAEKDVFKCRMAFYQECIESYIKHLKGNGPNPFVTAMGSAIEFFHECSEELRSAYGGRVDAANVFGCIKSYSPEAFFLALVEPGRKVDHPVLPDSLFCKWMARAKYVDHPISVILKSLNIPCSGDGKICTREGLVEVEKARKRFSRALLSELNAVSSSAIFDKIYAGFAERNTIDSLAGVEPSAAHTYLYGDEPFRKAYWDQTLYECSLILPMHEKKIAESRGSESMVNQELQDVRYFLENQMGVRAQVSYKKGTYLLDDQHWKGAVPTVNNFYQGPKGMVLTGCVLYEAMPTEIIENRGEYNEADLDNPAKRVPVNLERRSLTRLMQMTDYPMAKLSASESEHARLLA